eukprot:SAG31_NODE_4758_length_2974_cov_8.984696_1_plen_76_part_00
MLGTGRDRVERDESLAPVLPLQEVRLSVANRHKGGAVQADKLKDAHAGLSKQVRQPHFHQLLCSQIAVKVNDNWH